jgi:hypothetical protein
MPQLNIVLAILIKGYTTAMDIEEAQSASIFRDLVEIFSHESQRFIKICWKDYLFLSNDEIVQRLSASVGDSSFDKVLQKYNQIMLVGRTEIKPKAGIAMSAVDMHKILKEFFPELVVSVQSKEELFVHPILRGIMMRYGEVPVSKQPTVMREEACQMFLKRMQLETMRLVLSDRLCINSKALAALPHLRAQPEPNFQAGNLTTTVPDAPRVPSDLSVSGSFVLSVEINRMRNLPKMDLFRGVDAFCFIFLECAPGLFQTEVRRGLSEADWTWEPELSRQFQWSLPAASELLSPERKVVVMVYDKDQVSSDDLVGCVTVSLGELQNGIFDGWRRIIRPPDAWQSKYHCWMPPVAEIRLRVTLLPRHGILEDNKPLNSEAESGQLDNSLPLLAHSSSLRALPASESRFSTVATLSYPQPVNLPQKDCSFLPKHQLCEPRFTTNRAGHGLGSKSCQDNGSHDPDCFDWLPSSPHQSLILGTVPQRSTLEVQTEDGSGSTINYC